MEEGFYALSLILVLALYCVPGAVALTINHQNKWGIVALNLLLGWTGIGWIMAMIWIALDL